MSEQLHNWIRFLETEWSKPDGFLGKVREGVFDQREADAFAAKLDNIRLSHETVIDRRLVALLWYIPGFLHWQQQRIAKNSGDATAFAQLINRVQSSIEEILGVP